MSRKWSIPISSRIPATGILKLGIVAASTTSAERGTPAIPFEASIRVSIMTVISLKLRGTL